MDKLRWWTKTSPLAKEITAIVILKIILLQIVGSVFFNAHRVNVDALKSAEHIFSSNEVAHVD